MAEVYPTDAELIALLSEAETGVEYIPTGTAPYYLHFRKLLYRLLLATRRANDLRLYDEGGLTYGIKPGKFWAGKTLIEYAGSTGNVMPDNATRYIYLDRSGTLVITNMFSDMGFEPHVRLAIVSTSGGDITSIVDCRDQHSIAMPTSETVIVEAHTVSGDQLAHGESGSVHTNKGAAGAVTIFLPTFDASGTKYTFVVQENLNLIIDPLSNNISCWSGGGTAGYTLYSSTIGDCVTLVSDGNGNWMPTAMHGSWASGVS